MGSRGRAVRQGQFEEALGKESAVRAREAAVQALIAAAERAVLFLSGHTHGEGMVIHDRLGAAVDAVKGGLR